MNRNIRIFSFLPLTLALLAGCSSQPAANQAKKIELNKIQGKAQILEESGGSMDAALNAGGSSVYIWEGSRRYRLFLRNASTINHGDEYVVEGIDAQKLIDQLGDPDQGKNGYPLRASCETAVKTAWTNLAFDEIDADASALCAKVKRYPARPVFLVTRMRPAEATERTSSTADQKASVSTEGKIIPEVTVPAEKERPLLVEGQTTMQAPLWEPNGETIRCKVVIDPAGKISDLETGAQLCESVRWSEFRFQPPVQNGHPVKVNTEVEMRFEARTAAGK